MKDAEEQIAIDLGDEYEQALSGASQEEIIDLAGEVLWVKYFLPWRARFYRRG
jgi:hypothetical protein